MEEINGKEVNVVAVTSPLQRMIIYYFDSETGLLLQKIINDNKTLIILGYSVYSGVQIATQFTYYDGQMNSSFKVLDVKINQGLKSKDFKL